MASEWKHQGRLLRKRYQLTELLGQGALCEVYRGEDTVLRRPIAVKAVPPELVETYREALRSTAALTHPGVVATDDAIEDMGWLYLIQEHVSGRPLSAYLRDGIPSERAVDLAGQIACALSYAHAHEVLHGDLTPAAVLIDRQATVRLNNFGLQPDTAYLERFATILASSEVTDGLSVEDEPTALLAIPEDGDPAPDMAAIATAAPAATAADDVRGVGLLLWQVLSEPVRRALASAEADQQERDFRRDVPPELRELVHRCVVQTHPERIVDAETLALELEGLGELLAARRRAPAEETPPAMRSARADVAREASWSVEQTAGSLRPWNPEVAARGNRSPAPTHGQVVGWPEPDTPMVPRVRLPSAPLDWNNRPDRSARPTPRRTGAPIERGKPQTWPIEADAPAVRINAMLVVGLGAILFLAFFFIGFFGPNLLK